MKLTLRQFDQPANRRSAFTLTELVVAMGIFVVLATLTVGAFRTNSQDHVGNAAGNFKNALEGARSRAINSGEVRGLRLLVDPVDTHTVTSVVYVGAPGYAEATIPNVLFYGDYDFDKDGNLSSHPNDLDQDGDGAFDAALWGFRRTVFNSSFYTRNLIEEGNRVEIPMGSGNWYTIGRIEETGSELHNDGNLDLFIVGHFDPSVWSVNRYFDRFSESIDIRVELSPTILEGAEPVPIDPQVCIDLDGCIVPNSGSNAWRNSSGTYNTPMDILFNPNGTITGDLATVGVAHLLFSYRSDVILAGALSGRPTSDENPVIPEDPEKDRKAVSIFSTTGGIVVSNINAVDLDGTPYNAGTVAPGVAYKYAITGEEAK